MTTKTITELRKINKNLEILIEEERKSQRIFLRVIEKIGEWQNQDNHYHTQDLKDKPGFKPFIKEGETNGRDKPESILPGT